jgi:phytoene synthase
MLRRADPDRFFCTLFAPAEKRQGLALLYLFNHELARAREVASQPLLALIRLTWWREVVDGALKQHEIATPLSKALDAGVFAAEDLRGLISAREMEAELEVFSTLQFYEYARGTAGKLARIAGKVLGADSSLIEDFGTAYGISGMLRAAPFLARQQDRSLLPIDGTSQQQLIAHAKALLTSEKPPRAALAAALTAVYARRDFGKPAGPRTAGDRLAILRAAITGRI